MGKGFETTYYPRLEAAAAGRPVSLPAKRATAKDRPAVTRPPPAPRLKPPG
jgi:hypothetical protein